MIRVAVIDDEPLARSGIVARLARHDDLVIVGEYADGAAALEGLRGQPADLLLLDVQMPVLDGLGLLAGLPTEQRPMVIFLTAYANFAVRAFELRAVDYLLKPIDDDRLAEALNRARELHVRRGRDGMHTSDALAGDSAASRTRFPVRIGRRTTFVHAADVEWIEADGDYATLHTADGDYLLRESLGGLSAQLDPAQFVRVHRSAIVRLDCVMELQSLTNRDALLRLRDGTPLRVSRTYITALLDRLNDGRAIR